MDVIRDYDATRDAAQVRRCYLELQEFARALEPGLPEAEAVADAYLASMFARCAIWNGNVLVAEVDGEVAGFVCVWTTVRPEEPDEEQREYAYVSDLVVATSERRRGLGRRLLAAAEAHARARGVTLLKIGVLAKNEPARRLYAGAGFHEYRLELRKRLPARARA